MLLRELIEREQVLDKDLIQDFIDDGYTDKEILDLAQGEYDQNGVDLLRGYLPKIRAGLRPGLGTDLINPGLGTDLINSPMFKKLSQHRIRSGKSPQGDLKTSRSSQGAHHSSDVSNNSPRGNYVSDPGRFDTPAAGGPAATGPNVQEPHDPDSTPDHLDLYKSSKYKGTPGSSDYYIDPEDNYSDVTLDYMDDIEQLYQNGRNPDQIVRDLMSRYGLPSITARALINNYQDMKSGNRTPDKTSQRKQMSNLRRYNTNKGRTINRNKMIIPNTDQENL